MGRPTRVFRGLGGDTSVDHQHQSTPRPSSQQSQHSPPVRQAPRRAKTMCSLRAVPLLADVMLPGPVEVSTRLPRLTEVEGVRAVVHDSLRAHALLEGELKRPMML